MLRLFDLQTWVEDKCAYGERKSAIAAKFGLHPKAFSRLANDPEIMTDGKKLFREVKPRERRRQEA